MPPPPIGQRIGLPNQLSFVEKPEDRPCSTSGEVKTSDGKPDNVNPSLIDASFNSGEAPDTSDPATVIFFGSAGSGKSSIINMLPNAGGHGRDVAKVSNGVSGVTTTAQLFHKTLKGRSFRVYDTVGTGEGNSGNVSTHEAIEQLYKVLTQGNGIDLIVLVTRVGRFHAVDENNYRLIRYLCGEAVPVALVVTHGENEVPRRDWWPRQERPGYAFTKDVCVVSDPGLKDANRDLYEESKLDVQELLLSAISAGPSPTFPPKRRFDAIVDKVASWTGCLGTEQRGFFDLLLRYDIPKDKAARLVGRVKLAERR